VAAVDGVFPEDADSLVYAALRHVWTRLQKNHPLESAVKAVLQIVGGLENKCRQYRTPLIPER